ncbi:Molybdopterin-guanine dinucleotide biosynthesis protein A [Desulfotomaculum nigrificans CO-1-SRB]|uniref:Probable molybdenum cofactor guanylyltransferase n=1 Tax=Desulfotomaculum nigrificans (strain DSM 14880 / VKM B-2319 / CO-1-SRB) TaxID=868595 RepID=F6B9K5_DESCC|nr:Molybdopterin-guanine dinucleotide biosynthesis protein A [Desulfotomaculum nigrificans CO-1-SRB]
MSKNVFASAVILAGGKSSRMKTNKAMLNLHGTTMLQLVIDRLRPAFNEILIISNEPDQYKYLGLPVYCDIFPNRGPLAGIHAGLQNITTNRAFLVACDMPFVNTHLANELLLELDHYQVAVPRQGKFLQPLHAAYRKDCLPMIEQCLQTERPKITSFYDSARVKYFDFDEHPEYDWDTIFFNVNTPEDFQVAQAMDLKEILHR